MKGIDILATYNSLEKLPEGGWKRLKDVDYTPGIFITFKGGIEDSGMIYHYMEQEIMELGPNNTFESRMKLADYPMEEEVWDNWVKQSINRTSLSFIEKSFKEILIAADLTSTYITEGNFVSNLIQTNFETSTTPQTITTNQVLNLNLPFVDRIDPEKLMNVRNYEQDTFTNFRVELERQFRELRFVSDPKELKERQQNILHELGDVQVKRINIKLNSLKKKAIFDSAILVGGLAGTVITAGWSLLSAAVAGASGYKTYLDYKQNIRENPSYLLWKVLKK